MFFLVCSVEVSLCKGCDGWCVFSCIVTRGAVSACVWEVGVFRHADVVCLCLVCILHDLQFVNAGRGCKRRSYGRGILQSLSHECFIGSHGCPLLFTPSCCCECFYHL